MPRKTEWTRRIDSVIEELRGLASPWIDRAAVARLFAVSPRQALRIMHRLGAGSAGEALLIARAELIERLEALRNDEGVQLEAGRRERVASELERVRRQMSSTGVRLAPVRIANEALPEGVRITPGLMEVRFHTAEELLARLLELANLAAQDMDAFRASVGLAE